MASLAPARRLDLTIETDGALTASSLGRFLQKLEPVVRKGAGAPARAFRLELTELAQGSIKMTFLAIGGAASIATILGYIRSEMQPSEDRITPLSQAAASMILRDQARAVIISGPNATVRFDRNDAEEVERIKKLPEQGLLEANEDPPRYLIAPQTALVRYIDGEFFIRLERGAGPLLPVIDRRETPERLQDRSNYIVHGTVARDRNGDIHDFELTDAIPL
jgi:hypothetical protein